MTKEGYFLVVRFWVAPQAEAPMLRWLDAGHMAEVTSQSGFLWSKRIRTEKSAEGWPGYCMIYGIESKAAFDAYNANRELIAKFAREREPFAANLRIERFAGEVDA